MSALIGASSAKVPSSSDATDGKGAGLGDTAVDHNGNTLVYVSASGTIAVNDAVWVNNSFTAAALTPALAITAGRVGFAQVAFASGERGYVVLKGSNVSVNVLGGCAKDAPLYTSNTAGALDDATLSSSHYQISGVVLTTTIGSTASAGVAYVGDTFIRRPQV